MSQNLMGLHHITALTADAQGNLDFYAGVLGLRLVKRTVNFDNPDVYHLYYGNERGDPGTILTFFHYPRLIKGRRGYGQLTTISLAVGKDSEGYWLERFKKYAVYHQSIESRFDGERYLYFEDPEGLGLELVFSDGELRKPFSYGQIPLDMSIKGIHGVTLSTQGYEKTAQLLKSFMDHQEIAREGNRFRYTAKAGSDFVDILCQPDALKGYGGAGTVHHMAFATKDLATQELARQRVIDAGLDVTPVLNRQYFHSIYFKEPAGVLFEIATSLPGFTIDEEIAHLGEVLQLPPWQEAYRQEIVQKLPSLKWHPERFRDYS